MFEALVLHKEDSGATTAAILKQENSDLPAGEVEIAVSYSTLNYKDALAITGKGPVVRKWPMVPGIDLAGVVVSSDDSRYAVGTEVVVNGHGMGEVHWGGLAERARVPGDWITVLPDTLTPYDAMAIGTAGYTAMLSVLALERHGVKPEDGPIVVTGANGGVGSFAIALLAGRGYTVVASTGRPEESERLRALGASEIIDRSLLADAGKPLQKEQWAGAVDCVGSHTLANLCAQTKYGGVVTACGLAQGLDLPLTVAPFILRGVQLVGIDSVYASREARDRAWACLASETTAAMRAGVTRRISLDQVTHAAAELLAGNVVGRVVVDIAGAQA